MKKKSDRFKPVQRLSRSREQDAAKALGESNRAVSEQEQRLAELEQYREEYARYYEQRGREGISGAKLQELQRFLHNLNKAIEQQQQLVAMARQQSELSLNKWQQARGRSKAMDTVADRYRQAEEHDRARQEQKETDEHAQRKGASKPKP
jgi:flagellar FliJ protein